ncbi:hypothetical protein DOZ80_07635 [Pseudomonas fluorescens]|uniref:Uncharacterized protein n=1 Tax=Pseudomonas fluorescens TaxID=294 RepID=A0A327NGL2_PSEFL|nr:hypothetical protein DOZ80_07635 [Pseudomonas fluorescens]
MTKGGHFTQKHCQGEVPPIPLWELACSRRRFRQTTSYCLTYRFREQARSHKDPLTVPAAINRSVYSAICSKAPTPSGETPPYTAT